MTSPLRVRRKYKNPPVIEALCELFFEGSEWDDATVGRFYDRVKERFPRRRQMELQEAQFTFSDKGDAAAGIRRMAPQMQFLNEEGNSLLQLRRDLLVINQLRPYPHFEGWEPNIYWALKIYGDLTKPKGIRRIGVRYINRIVVPLASIRMEDYFNIYPQLPKETGDVHGAFIIRVELPCSQKGHGILVTFASASPEEPGQTAHLLDLYDTFRAESPLGAQDVATEIRAAHGNIETAFEGSITDPLRTLFEPVT